MDAARNLTFSVLDTHEVSAVLVVPAGAKALLVLAHGAGAGMKHPFMEAIARRLYDDGIATLRYQFPYMEQRRRVPDSPKILTATAAAAVNLGSKTNPELPLLAGGKSMGGRMTSQAAADGMLPGVRGIVFLGFPLHSPKQPATKRADHLKLVEQPMLFLQGTRDELADLALLRPICESLAPRASLEVIDGADHSFHVLKKSGTTDAEVLARLSGRVRDWCSTVFRRK